ncbi:hypothetical protein J2Z76_002590 [Sedimentibacter acidaminivorans]|uniref:WG repeat-containing protein n=1 Tax=Sedimentibacter acidaminivorans TaxID=913099 RepID=A0ABS4GG93_9FIRM|nr:WG repeat-containing protein [Sedimentibacter acidaminivorans]MBP1926720.1 hypothetical protein [Sedimentibacter acidaminivorans]
MDKKIKLWVIFIAIVISLTGCSLSNTEEVDTDVNVSSKVAEDLNDNVIDGLIIEQKDFSSVKNRATERLIGVQSVKNSMWGFIDAISGNYVIEPQFNDVQEFSDGLAAVQNREGYWGFIDKNGELVIDYNFDLVSRLAVYNSYYSFNNGYCFVEAESLNSGIPEFAIINNTGKVLCELENHNTVRGEWKNIGQYALSTEGDLYDVTLNKIVDSNVKVIEEEYYIAYRDSAYVGFDYKGNEIFKIDSKTDKYDVEGYEEYFILLRHSDKNSEVFCSLYDIKGKEIINENDNLQILHLTDNKLLVKTITGIKIFDIETKELTDTDWDNFDTWSRKIEVINDRYIVEHTSLYDIENCKMYDFKEYGAFVASVLGDKVALIDNGGINEGNELIAINLLTGEVEKSGIVNPKERCSIPLFICKPSFTETNSYFVRWE